MNDSTWASSAAEEDVFVNITGQNYEDNVYSSFDFFFLSRFIVVAVVLMFNVPTVLCTTLHFLLFVGVTFINVCCSALFFSLVFGSTRSPFLLGAEVNATPGVLYQSVAGLHSCKDILMPFPKRAQACKRQHLMDE